MGCHFLSTPDCCNRTTPVVKSELSASTLNERLSLGKMRTGCKVTVHFKVLKAVYWASVQLLGSCQGTTSSKVSNSSFGLVIGLTSCLVH